MKLSTLYSLYGDRIVGGFLSKNKRYKVKGDWIGTPLSLMNKSKTEESEEKIEMAKDLAGYFHLIPWIMFAAVSGSVSFGSAQKYSDIDIFLVVAKNRLWITRGLEEVLFNILGVRKVLWRKGTKNKLCINFYTSENNLSLDIKKKHRFLTALETVMLKPIFKESYHHLLMSKNRWVQKYFPGLEIKRPKQKSFPRLIILSQIFDILDLLAMLLQLGFMKGMGHSTKNSTLKRDRITFFDQNEKWERRTEVI
ncbi:MAG: hypothetical protein ABIC57_01015 [bacterium]